MKLFRCAMAVCVLCGLAAALPVPALAQGHLDPGFGEGGVVKVQPPLPAPWQYQSIQQMAAGRDGSTYVHAARSHCDSARCYSAHEIFRYSRDGKLDTSFGAGGAYELPPESGATALAVDSAGRPLIASAGASSIEVRRLTTKGLPDPDFGSGGAVSLPCACEYNQTQLVPGPAGTVTVVLPRSGFGEVVRLRADGSLASGFGRGGVLQLGMRGGSVFSASPPGPAGPTYLAENACCSQSFVRLLRISRRGRVDRRFTRAAARSLRRVDLLAVGMRVTAVVARPRGIVDVFGQRDYRRAFLVRLGSDGRPLRRFGHHGLRKLPQPVVSAALGSKGAVLAVSEENRGRSEGSVFRILRGGRLDDSFGIESVPDSIGDTGMSIAALTEGRALVLNLGLQECRGFCRVEPELVRYLEDPKRG